MQSGEHARWPGCFQSDADDHVNYDDSVNLDDSVKLSVGHDDGQQASHRQKQYVYAQSA